jgi:hypothetical protein
MSLRLFKLIETDTVPKYDDVNRALNFVHPEENDTKKVVTWVPMQPSDPYGVMYIYG